MSIILGPATSGQTKETFPIAQVNQVVAISPTSSARGLSGLGDFVFRVALTTDTLRGLSGLGDFVFRVALTTDTLIPIGIEVTHAKLGYQRAATIYDAADFFSTDGDASVQEVLTAKGIEVLTTENFQGGDTDFSEQLTRIQKLNPDVIYVSCLSPEKPGILTQGHELGISAPFIVRTLTGKDVQASGPAAEDAITFVGWGAPIKTPGNQAFVKNYSARYGAEPVNPAARSYATFNILAEAIAKTQSTDVAAIRDALANVKDFDTISGKFSFDANGDAVYDAKVLIVKDGELVVFE